MLQLKHVLYRHFEEAAANREKEKGLAPISEYPGGLARRKITNLSRASASAGTKNEKPTGDRPRYAVRQVDIDSRAKMARHGEGEKPTNVRAREREREKEGSRLFSIEICNRRVLSLSSTLPSYLSQLIIDAVLSASGRGREGISLLQFFRSVKRGSKEKSDGSAGMTRLSYNDSFVFLYVCVRARASPN